MISSSQLIKCIAAGVAICAHGAAALAVMAPPKNVEMDGMSGAAETRLGSSFADMATGTLSAISPENTPTTPPVTPTVQSPVVPAPVPALQTPVGTTAFTPAALTPVVQHTIAKAQSTPTADTLRAFKPTARPERPIKETVKPAQPQKQSVAKTTAAKPKTHTTPRGNSTITARAGQTDGKATAKATSKGDGGQKATSGNAAASNYNGKVMRKLSRISRPRVSVKGSAIVAFKVSASGGLAGISLKRSSGSSELDRAAIKVVTRAAPFPAPPAGAQRSFNVEIKGR